MGTPTLRSQGMSVGVWASLKPRRPGPRGPICHLREVQNWFFFSALPAFRLPICQHYWPPCINSSFQRTVLRFLFKPIHSCKTKWRYPTYTGPKISSKIPSCAKILHWINMICDCFSKKGGISGISRHTRRLSTHPDFPLHIFWILLWENFQFVGLPFGIFSAPLVFTTVLSQLLVLLQIQVIHVTGFLDALLLKNSSTLVTNV